MISNKMIETYITFRNYFNKGWGEFSWIRAPVERIVALALLAKVANLDYYLICLFIILAVAGMLACFVFGFWWDKRKAFEIENDWNYKRSCLKKLVK